MNYKNRRTVCVFDFDGTLTTRDTLLLFIRHTHGTLRFLLGFLLFSPLIIMMLMRLFPNWKAKEKVFSLFFRGMTHDRFLELGEAFASKEAGRICNTPVIDILRRHLANGDKVYIVSASIEDWVRPFLPHWVGSEAGNNITFLCTQAEISASGTLTGHFLTKNCYGPEKVARLLQAEPDRASYFLYAYGDSNGDREMLTFADKGTNVKKNANNC